jgi:hypothetical protein
MRSFHLLFVSCANKFLINLKGSFMPGGWQLFSLILLVGVEGSLLKWWVALYTLARVWRREEREKHTCVLAHLTSLGHGEVMAMGARRAPEWSAEIQPKASHVRRFLL